MSLLAAETHTQQLGKGGPTRDRVFAYRRWGCSYGCQIGDRAGLWVRSHLWYRVARWWLWLRPSSSSEMRAVWGSEGLGGVGDGDTGVQAVGA